MIRIIGGIAGGRRLKVPRVKDIRPTSDRVRESLFNSLGGRVVGVSVLDLFCGSGALGIEAMSRGAFRCVFVDRNRACTAAARENARKTELLARARFITRGVEAALRLLAKENERFEVIFMDPPYHRDLGRKTLRALCAYDILCRTALVIVEHHRKESMADTVNSLSLQRKFQHGETVLSFYSRLFRQGGKTCEKK